MDQPCGHHRIGVIGLGAMGLGTARALLDRGFEVVGFDVDAQSLTEFERAGGRSASTPGEVATLARILLTVVVNEQQVDQALFGDDGVAHRADAGSLLLQCSTVSPAYTRGLTAPLLDRGIGLLDAPISGGTAKARRGELTIMASGAPEHFEHAAAVFDAMAATVYRLGDLPGAGSSMKLVNQLLAGVHIATAAEAMAFGIRAGIEPETLYEVITHSAGNSWMFENRMRHVLDGDYTPHSAVDIFVKDLGLVAGAGQAMTFPTPLAATALQLFTATSAAGLGREDDAAVIKVFQRNTGIELPAAANDE